MSAGRRTGAGLRWSPLQLGRSLPIYGPLWVSRGVAAAVVLATVGWAALRGLATIHPRAEAHPDPQGLVTQQLRTAELPVWDPGPPLGRTKLPDWEPFPAPTLWRGGSLGDSPLHGETAALVERGRAELRADNPDAAATHFLRAANVQPTWEVLYSTGLALLAADDPELAVDKLKLAEERLVAIGPWAPRPSYHAAEAATRYAAGLAALQYDCVRAILHLRRSIWALDGYVDAEGAFVRDRLRPFAVDEAGIDNHSLWGTLARAYERCEERFPADYERELRLPPQDFAKEYKASALASPEVRDGPFTESLTECVRGGRGKQSGRCWAFSNLNKPVMASRTYFSREDPETVGRGLSPEVLDSVARLLYDTAWTAARYQQDQARALPFLRYAVRVDRKAQVPGLAQRIAELGRYLAPDTKDYSLLATPWSDEALASLTLDATMKPETLKGAAWALRERWTVLLREQQPAAMFDEIEAQVKRAGPHGESLIGWRDGVREQLRGVLAGAIDAERKGGNVPAALAIRDYEAPWLGDGWPRQAMGAWVTWRTWLHWTGLLLLCLAVAALAFLVHRLVVFPYLLYTTDFYRLEHRRRHAARKGKPFTRKELEAARSASGTWPVEAEE